MTFNWDDEKNELLKRIREISFEEIVIAIEDGNVVDVVRHHDKDRYSNQRIYLVAYRNYIYAVPFVQDMTKKEIFLKTIYPSRRYTKQYLGDKEEET